MDFAGKLLDAVCGSLPATAKQLIPEHLRRQALERLQDHNPFKTIASNHDLTRAVRLAWIEAAGEILDAAGPASETPEWSSDERADTARFIGMVRPALLEIRDAALDRRTHPGDNAIDAHVGLLVQGVGEFITPSVTGKAEGTGNGITRSFAGTLAALVANGDVREVPPIIGRVAAEGLPTHSGGPPRPFGDLVFAAFAELLKDPKKYPQAGAAFHIVMDTLARDLGTRTLEAVRGLDTRLDAALSGLNALDLLRHELECQVAPLPQVAEGVVRIVATQDQHTEMLNEIMSKIEAAGLTRRAADQGIPEAAIRAIVERLGGEGVGTGDLVPWLEDWIVVVQRELGRHSNEGEAFEAARREAERRFRAGRIGEASAAFMDELAREEQEEAERQEERKRYRLRLLEEAIRFDELAFDGKAAVEKLRQIARIEGIEDPKALGAWLHDKAVDFYERGEQKGENAQLLVSLATFHAVLKECPRKHMPYAWAIAQCGLGSVLSVLGKREGNVARLEEAVAAFHAALEEQPRERVPRDWATTQSNLGSALLALGEWESSTEKLEKAIIIFRAALEERPRDDVPLDWALIQNNLGNALSILGKRENDTARLKEAVTAYRAALDEWTRERVPFKWATAQNNLGNVLQKLGEWEGDIARLEEAVTAFRAALQEQTRKCTPLDWAGIQNNLGNVLRTLSQLERMRDSRRLEDAVTAYRAALEEWTRERVPLYWAMAQDNLGNALQMLGEQKRDTAKLEEAIAAHHTALLERTRERFPLDWSVTQNNLGNALAALGQLQHGTTRLKEAVTAYRNALLERPRENVPFLWAATQSNLGNALVVLGVREHGTARLEDAIAAYSAALQEQTRERIPLHWAKTRSNLGIALTEFAKKKNDWKIAQKALDLIADTRDVCNGAGHPYAANCLNQMQTIQVLIKQLGG